MSNSRKVVPITTKRLISSTFGFERPLTPNSVKKNLLVPEDERNTPPENQPRNSISKESPWEQFKRKTRRRSLFWILSSVTAAIWLIVLTVLYAIHLQNADHSKLIQVIERTIEVPECKSDAECTSPTPYCDTQYTNQCSECVQSSQCTNPAKPFCDIYGSRSCHECVVNRDCPGSLICDTSETRVCAECFAAKDCSSNAIKKLCVSNECVECASSSDCLSQPVNKLCYNGACVQCTKNVHCAGEPLNKICDLSSYTCAAPCTSDSCAADPDGKTKCCGTKCIQDCAVGFICNVFESQCVPKIEGTPRGTNVPTNPSKVLAKCSHCHYTNVKMTGSMFDKSMLSNIDYLTGIEYIFSKTTTVNPNMEDAKLFFQEAPTCDRNDFTPGSSLIELGTYPTITSTKVEFDNVLPVTSDCFFILTQATFKVSIDCEASYDYTFQVGLTTANSKLTLDHTPYYSLYGY